jgi:hypothetical protein
MVSGVDAMHPARMDTYTKMHNVMHAGRPVYQLDGPTVTYLFYSASTGDWRIDSDYLLPASSSARSTGSAGAACPDQATGWQANTGGAWVSTYPITVVPTRPPTLPATAPPANVGDRPSTSGDPRGEHSRSLPPAHGACACNSSALENTVPT